MMNGSLTRHALVPALLLFSNLAIAHGDAGVPLYVAENGEDKGDCANAETPCATISFALSRAGKGGQIRVAEGTYAIANPDDLFHIVGGVVDVQGGFRPSGKPKILPTELSVLTGVPAAYRDEMFARGFRIIADRKATEKETISQTDRMLKLRESLKSSIAATPCVGGSAAGLPCENVDLLSHVAFSDVSGAPDPSTVMSGADVWGFVDLNTNREYAIVSYSFGTAVFDVTDATLPREVGFVAGPDTTWRDVKVYQHYDEAAERFRAYAYITADGATDGLVVVDLSGLPHAVNRVSFNANIQSAHNIYAANSDYSTGLALSDRTPTLIVAGSDFSDGRFLRYSLENPSSPSLISGGLGNGYMHDASSLIITDSRKDTQCLSSGPYCEVLLDFNENNFKIWDVTNSGAAFVLSEVAYGNAGYVHSGWWSEDKQYIFVQDELDERNRGLATTLRVFSIADLTQPTLAGTWTGPTAAIDHNGFVRGNRYYMSNYTRGLTILDITDPASPTSAGRLDTYPMNDSSMFNGAWGAYPYLYSGNIIISDIDSGFYMATDNSRNVPQGSFQFSNGSAGIVEGQAGQLVVQRGGGTNGDVSVQLEIVNATTTAGDYVISGNVLTWTDGDNSDKAVSLSAVNDGTVEGLERLLVRLISPAGGATLGNLNTASVYLSDPGAATELGFAETVIQTAERGFATLIATVQRRGTANGAVSVDFSITGGSASIGDDFQGMTSGTLSWQDGDGDPKTIEFAVVDDGINEADEFFDLALSNPAGAALATSATLNANIIDGSSIITPPSSGNGGGGGALSWWIVCLFGSVTYRRRRNCLG